MASIETLLEENTAAANRLADLLEAQGGGAPKTAAGAKDKPKPAAAGNKAPKIDFEAVKALVVAVKDTIGEPEAKAILTKHNPSAPKLAAIANTPDKWAAIAKSAQAALDAHEAAADEPEAEADEDDGI